MRGIAFEMKNEYGTHLGDFLNGIITPTWYWMAGPKEAYKSQYGSLAHLYPYGQPMSSAEFMTYITDGSNYIVHADLKVFPTLESIKAVNTFEEILNSPCELVVVVTDIICVYIFTKSDEVIHHFFERAKKLGFENINYIQDEESRYSQLNVG